MTESDDKTRPADVALIINIYVASIYLLLSPQSTADIRRNSPLFTYVGGDFGQGLGHDFSLGGGAWEGKERGVEGRWGRNKSGQVR